MVILRKFQQLLQIKIGGNDTRTAFSASYALQSCSIWAGTIRIGLPKYMASHTDSNPAVLA